MSKILPWEPSPSRASQAVKVVGYGSAALAALVASRLLARRSDLPLRPGALKAARVSLMGIAGGAAAAALLALWKGVCLAQSPPTPIASSTFALSSTPSVSDSSSKQEHPLKPEEQQALQEQLVKLIHAKKPRSKAIRSCALALGPLVNEPLGPGLGHKHAFKLPLHEAIFTGREKVIKALVEGGADPSQTDEHMQSGFHRALRQLTGQCQDRVIAQFLETGKPIPTCAPDCGDALPNTVCGFSLTHTSKSLIERQFQKDRQIIAYAKRGDANAVRKLLNKGCPVYLRDPKHESLSALEWAIKQKHVAVAAALLEYFPKMLAADKAAALDISLSQKKTSSKIIALLLQQDADPFLQHGKEPPGASSEAKKRSQRLLPGILDQETRRHANQQLKKKANARTTLTAQEKNSLQYDLYVHIEDETDVKTLQKLARALGEALSEGYQECDPPLMHAVQHGKLLAAQVLLEEGADPNLELPSGTSLLTALVRLRDPRFQDHALKLLLRYGFRPPTSMQKDFTRYMTPTLRAAVRREQFLSEQLFEQASAGNDTLVHRLLKVGVPPDIQKETTRETPLHQATRGGHAKVVKHLLQAGASASLADAEDCTPLDFAIRAEKPQLKIVKHLLEAKANPLRTPAGAPSPLSYARAQFDADSKLLACLESHTST